MKICKQRCLESDNKIITFGTKSRCDKQCRNELQQDRCNDYKKDLVEYRPEYLKHGDCPCCGDKLKEEKFVPSYSPQDYPIRHEIGGAYRTWTTIIILSCKCGFHSRETKKETSHVWLR